MLETLYKIEKVHFRLLDTKGFQVKAKNERFSAASWRCRHNLKNQNFTSSFGRFRYKNCTERRAARAARLFSIIQPIISLICCVAVNHNMSG